ncbi:sulfatase [Lentisphaera marina]|uniref:sulfatase n=1 Tax=Lentisphaera marina TaxID=1111041 RepID=UPI0023669D27|nr:sulfatase [Lentisphaera marina]MDD7987282.1 sulfatase [Lentisphaera marina]
MRKYFSSLQKGFTTAFLLFMGLGMNAADKPNFIIFYMDDLGWADTSHEMKKGMTESKSDFHETPNVERLAKQGLTFTQGYSPAPTCTPSRISIHYGKTNARLGYTTVHDVLANNRGLKESIPKDNKSIAHVMNDAGYTTAHFGKGIAIAKPQEIGYQVHDAFDVGDNGNYHGDYVKIAPESEREKLPVDNPKRIYSLTKSSVDFVNEQAKSDKPFFMMVSHYAVHVPHAASPEIIEKYRNKKRGKYLRDEDYMDPSEMSVGQRTCTWRLQYAAMLEEADMNLGAIMDALEANGQADNTYIVFTSDNGGGLTPNGALTGGKANLFEGGLRVPTIIAGPKVLKNQYCDVPVIQWDLLTTFHDLSNSSAPLPKDVDGGSLRQVFAKGNNGKVKRPNEGIVFNYPYYAAAPINAIIVGKYKLMRQLNTGEIKLFNIDEDLAEKNNLAQQSPEIAARLAQQMDSYLAEVNAPKIEDVYEARLTELANWTKEAKFNFKNNLEIRSRNKSASEIKLIKAQLKKKYDADMARFKKSTEHCQMQMLNKNFIGGNYEKIQSSSPKKEKPVKIKKAQTISI